jgi:transposase
MPNPHPLALRERAVRAYAAGGTYKGVAEQFAVSDRSVLRWVMQERETGSLAPLEKGGGHRSPVDGTLLQQVLDEKPDGITEELTRLYNARVPRSQRVHRSSILRALKRADYVFKKNVRGPQKRTDRTSAPSGRPSSSGRPR